MHHILKGQLTCASVYIDEEWPFWTAQTPWKYSNTLWSWYECINSPAEVIQLCIPCLLGRESQCQLVDILLASDLLGHKTWPWQKSKTLHLERRLAYCWDPPVHAALQNHPVPSGLAWSVICKDCGSIEMQELVSLKFMCISYRWWLWHSPLNICASSRYAKFRNLSSHSQRINDRYCRIFTVVKIIGT